MPFWIALLLLVANVPVFYVLHQRFFASAADWQRALAFDNTRQTTWLILQQDWQALRQELRLAEWVALCGLLVSTQYAVILGAWHWL